MNALQLTGSHRSIHYFRPAHAAACGSRRHPLPRKEECPLQQYFIGILETNYVEYTITHKVEVIHRLSAVRSILGVRWSHVTFNLFGIPVLLPYYKSLNLEQTEVD